MTHSDRRLDRLPPYRCGERTDGLQPPKEDTIEGTRVILHWIPLGAGGSVVVRLSGRIYELIRSVIERRRPCDLYHTALEVVVDGDLYTVENAWPVPDSDLASRGVVVVGPVFSPRLTRFRVFRYEVRCWRYGSIPDIAAVVSSQSLTTEPELARRILARARSVPPLTWGRDVLGVGEMWNSNSVVSYLLSAAGMDAYQFLPPEGGRAPGWESGIHAAQIAPAVDRIGERQR